MHWFRLAFGFLLGFCATGIRSSAQVALVVTTHPVLLDVVRQLAADDVRVECLVPTGTSVRDYDPTAEGVRTVREASLLVVHGVDLDAWIDGMIRESGYNKDVAVATDRMPLLDINGRVHEPEDERELDFSQFDANTWHDPRNVIHFARVIAVALTDLLPSRAADIDDRLRAYVRELEELHAYAEAQFNALPPARRRLATSHDTLGYLGATYGLQIGLIPGFEAGRPPQPVLMGRMIDLVASLNVPAIFLGAGTPSLASRELESATGVRVITTLFTDTLGAPGSADGRYTVRFRRNVDTIVESLR